MPGPLYVNDSIFSGRRANIGVPIFEMRKSVHACIGVWGECVGLRARICKHFKEHRNRFLAWRVGTTTLFDGQATKAGGIDSLESIPGLHKRFKIRARQNSQGNHGGRTGGICPADNI